MAILNKPGALMYHIALLIFFGTVFLTLKNLNFEDISDTPSYSYVLRTWIFSFVAAALVMAGVVTIASLVSRARKTRFAVGFLLVLLWVNMFIMSLFAYFQGILREDLIDEGYRWVIIAGSSLFFFLIVLGLLLFKFPGEVEEGVLAEKVKKKLERAERKEEKPFCPICKTTVESSFKYCPGCGAKFSD